MGAGVFVAAPGEATPLGDGTLLWRRDDGHAVAVLDPSHCALLEDCAVYDTLAGHAARAASALGESPDRLRAMLEDLAARGLLLDLDSALAGATPAASKAPEPRVILRVLGDGSGIARSLRALAAARPAGRSIAVDVLVPAGMEPPRLPDEPALALRVVDAAMRQSLFAAWAARLDPGARTAVAGLLAETAAPWWRASWNWALLLGRGGTLALVDDVVAWPPRFAPDWHAGLVLGTPARRGAWRAPATATAPTARAVDDPLGIASRYLGQSARTLAAAYPGVTARARGLAVDAVLWPAPGARVRAIALGHVAAARAPAAGAADDDGFDAAAFAALAAAAQDDAAAVVVANRIGALVARSPLEPCFIDARGPLPPMPMHGGSTAWFGLCRALDGDAVLLELPLYLTAPARPDGEAEAEPLATLLASAGAGFTGATRDPGQVAARVGDLADAATDSLAQCLRARGAAATERRLLLLDAAAAQAPAGLRAALLRWRAEAAQWLARPLDACAADALRATLAELAIALPAWARLWAVADEPGGPA